MIRLSTALILFGCLIGSSNALRAEIIIDGIIDEIEWNDAQVFDEFVTVEPLSGDSAKYKTEVKLLTNPQGIYVAFLNYQQPSVKSCLLYTSPSPRD